MDAEDKYNNNKKEDFYAVVSAIVKFIGEADRTKDAASKERTGLVEDSE